MFWGAESWSEAALPDKRTITSLYRRLGISVTWFDQSQDKKACFAFTELSSWAAGFEVVALNLGRREKGCLNNQVTNSGYICEVSRIIRLVKKPNQIKPCSAIQQILMCTVLDRFSCSTEKKPRFYENWLKIMMWL